MSSWWKSQRLEQAALRHRIIRRRWADPTAIRQWHKPSDPIQAARIEAAAAKRARRAEKLEEDTIKAAFYNRAQHGIPFAHTLNPTYIAR